MKMFSGGLIYVEKFDHRRRESTKLIDVSSKQHKKILALCFPYGDKQTFQRKVY